MLRRILYMCKCARICIYPLVILPLAPNLPCSLGLSPHPPARIAESDRAPCALRGGLQPFTRRSHRPALRAMDLLAELEMQAAAADAWPLPESLAVLEAAIWLGISGSSPGVLCSFRLRGVFRGPHSSPWPPSTRTLNINTKFEILILITVPHSGAGWRLTPVPQSGDGGRLTRGSDLPLGVSCPCPQSGAGSRVTTVPQSGDAGRLTSVPQSGDGGRLIPVRALSLGPARASPPCPQSGAGSRVTTVPQSGDLILILVLILINAPWL